MPGEAFPPGVEGAQFSEGNLLILIENGFAIGILKARSFGGASDDGSAGTIHFQRE
jgi:hypothetical protein